jgi:hypothetical protein
MPLWLTLLLLAFSVVLWSKGSTNRDDVIGLLELLLGTAALMVCLFAGHHLLLDVAGVALALWLPKAHADMASYRAAESDDLLLPF